jgi:Zn-dependent protease
MKTQEIYHIIAAIITLTIVSGFTFMLKSQWNNIFLAFVFSIIIITFSVFAKKTMAHLLDSDVEHEIWHMKYFGGIIPPYKKLKKPFPTGIILPLILTFLSLGTLKFSAFLTYEARALKHRAAKRFGFYSFTEMTDWHHAIIGGSAILILLVLSLISYLLPFNLEYLSKLSIFYALSNLIPFSKLDGAQIFFGSRILWSVLTTITLVATFLAITVI